MKSKNPFGPERPDIAGGNVLPFPKREGATNTGPVAPRTTVDMLRELFSPSKGLLGEGTGAEVVPLGPARFARDAAAKEGPTPAPVYGQPPTEIADLRARLWESIANKAPPRLVPPDVAEVMKGRLGNLGFDRAGQAIGALREDLRTMTPEALKRKWDIQGADELPFQKILNHIKGTEE